MQYDSLGLVTAVCRLKKYPQIILYTLTIDLMKMRLSKPLPFPIFFPTAFGLPNKFSLLTLVC